MTSIKGQAIPVIALAPAPAINKNPAEAGSVLFELPLNAP